jgi:hypothetical protein
VWDGAVELLASPRTQRCESSHSLGFGVLTSPTRSTEDGCLLSLSQALQQRPTDSRSHVFDPRVEEWIALQIFYLYIFDEKAYNFAQYQWRLVLDAGTVVLYNCPSLQSLRVLFKVCTTQGLDAQPAWERAAVDAHRRKVLAVLMGTHRCAHMSHTGLQSEIYTHRTTEVA